jgi:ABC-type polysaccharide/polyol phosphate transport system ATPase subunit
MTAERGAPLAVEVRDVHKTFLVPTHRVDTLKERATHPFRRMETTRLEALRGISFDVRKGEMMGIVGRNGSGKTTLLKLLASIYRADRGSIRVAGTLAPFIELGVGFNPSLTARDNVLLNGVMMGLTPAEARRRFDEVIEFAELEDFVELKLKNYSSGMALRLAFSVMVQADAEVMLVDEVLAVGDASFAQKCTDSFNRMRAEGRTILFVTHDMESMRSLCDEAVLIHDGVIVRSGDADEVARHYFQLNFAESGPASSERRAVEPGTVGRIANVWLEDDSGQRNPQGFEHGGTIHLHAELVAEREIPQPAFSFEVCVKEEGTRVFSTPLDPVAGDRDMLAPGEVVRYSASVVNSLAPGSYVVNCSFSQNEELFDFVDLRRPVAELVVWGERQLGLVEMEWRSDVTPAPEARPARVRP